MKRIHALLPMLSLFAFTAWACGPFYTANYLVNGLRTVNDMAGIGYEFETRRIYERMGYATAMNYFNRTRRSSADAWPRTVVKAKADFAEAVSGHSEATRLVAAYNRVRDKLEVQGKKRIQNEQLNEERRLDWSVVSEPLPPPEPLNLAALEEDLAILPVEFERYLRGAAAWHNSDRATAIAYFEQVLELPAEERFYRSTWAAFMLGKAHAESDPRQAATWFAKVVEFQESGFHDVLDLAPDAMFLLARAEANAGDIRNSIHHYAQAGAVPAFWKFKWGEEIDPAVAADPLAREIITNYLIAFRDATLSAKWLSALEKTIGQEPLPDFGRQAWAMYRSGDMEAAARWANLAAPEDAVALWVRGKLALRAGDLKTGTALLEEASQSMPGDILVDFDGDMPPAYEPEYPARAAALGDAAFAHLLQQDYVTAFERFMECGNGGDARILAERVLSLEELAGANPVSSAYRNDFFHRIQAQAFARAGAWDTAATKFQLGNAKSSGYHPIGAPWSGIESLGRAAGLVHESLLEFRNSDSPDRERAQAALTAADLLRELGNSLMGDVYRPSPVLTRYLNDSGKSEPWFEKALCSGDLGLRFSNSAPDTGPCSTYRYVCSDLYWQAAQLLPDNDPLTAKALYDGGMVLQIEEPEAADSFYKALVRRNPNLLIAQQADALRWFPETFTDEVVFTPWERNPAPLLRKRYRVLLAALAVGALLGAGLYAGRRSRKSRTASPQ